MANNHDSPENGDDRTRRAPDPASEVPEPQADTEPKNEPEKEPAPEPVAARATPGETQARPGRGLAWLALLLALSAAGASGWVAWQWSRFEPPRVEQPELPDVAALVAEETAALEQELDGVTGRLADLGGMTGRVEDLREALDRRTKQLESRLEQQLRAGDDATAARVEELASELRAERSATDRRLAALEEGLARISQHGLDSERGVVVAEAAFLMRVASERLNLFGDPRGARQALSLADEQLRALDDPLYSGVRQALATEIQALESVAMPDRAAISGRLLDLARGARDWPLDARRRLAQGGGNLMQPDAEDTGWTARVREALASVVSIHDASEGDRPLLTLDEERLLRENLQLQLQAAQLAAVRGEQALYAASLELATEWLKRYYEAAAVSEPLATLEELQSIDLEPALPEIGDALRRLRNLQAASSPAGDDS